MLVFEQVGDEINHFNDEIKVVYRKKIYIKYLAAGIKCTFKKIHQQTTKTVYEI